MAFLRYLSKISELVSTRVIDCEWNVFPRVFVSDVLFINQTIRPGHSVFSFRVLFQEQIHSNL